jgi:hypothetical protein
MPYKATYNYKCRNQTYEIGQEYKIDEMPMICYRGFHYCINPKNVLTYYPITSDFKLLEIEDLSNDTFHKDDKSCSNHIKIIREITDKDELFSLLGVEHTFDEKGNELKVKDSNGFCIERTYDEKGNQLTCKHSNGYWSVHTYNEQGKALTYKTSEGYWRNYTYDSFGNELTFEDSNRYWRKSTYDSKGRITSHKDSTGFWREYTYDENGNQII